jgi:nucleoside-diphosphate-sugar epimerase
MIRKKVLILGGAGYLGQNIAKRFSSETNYLTTIGDLVEPSTPISDFIEVDVFNNPRVESVIQEHDIIINCTGQITKPINKCLKINTEGLANITNAAIKHGKKIFQISTLAVYGSCNFADENSELNPESPYASFKAFAEFQIQTTSKHNFCILRLPNLYGGNQVKGVFAYLLRSFKSDKKLEFNNDGNLSRYFLHISDCAEAIFMAVDKNITGIYNVTAREKYSIKEIIQKLETEKSIRFETFFEQKEPIENIKKVSFDAFTRVTGFEPAQTINSLIRNSFV